MKTPYLLIVVGLAVAGCGKPSFKSKNQPSTSAAPVETEERRDPVAVIPDEKLHAEFGGNLIAAETKYVGKWVKIRGFVGGIGKTKEGGGYRFGMMAHHNSFDQPVSQIVFTIAKGTEREFSAVQIGLPVEVVAKVVGRVDDAMTAGGYRVVLTDAHLSRHGADVPTY